MAFIDATKPVDGTPAVKADLRNNLTAIKSAVEAGQSSTASTTPAINANSFGVGTTGEREFLSIRCTASTAISASLENDVPAGKSVELVRAGSGDITAAAGAGASLVKPVSASFSTTELHEAMVFVVDTNVGGSSAAWRLVARP